MKTKKIVIVVGTRPNFIKITQFKKAARKYPDIEIFIVHTGQHYDRNLSTVFFDQLGVTPDVFLGVDSASPVKQMAKSMIALEKVFAGINPRLVIVPGDVNSTFAAAFTASRMSIPVAHIESGLRSFDRTMPEEFNRILTDALADLFFVTERSGLANLLREGKKKELIHFVGNTMIDSLIAFKSQIDESPVLSKLKLSSRSYVLMTMHRPSNVDSKEGILKIMELINGIPDTYKIIFPVHPRTKINLKKFGLYKTFTSNKKIILTKPLDYFSFQKLIKESTFLITDSGGIQEESTYLKIPCLTLRTNTERPVTITTGTNELLPFDVSIMQSKIKSIEKGNNKKGKIPPLWDGKATERILDIIVKYLK